MTEPTIDLDAILGSYLFSATDSHNTANYIVVTKEDAKAAMLQACKECLRVASERGKVENGYVYGSRIGWKINKQSILNVEKLIKL